MAREIGRQDQAWGESGPEDQENNGNYAAAKGLGWKNSLRSPRGSQESMRVT